MHNFIESDSYNVAPPSTPSKFEAQYTYSPFPQILALLQATLGIWSQVDSMGCHSLCEVCVGGRHVSSICLRNPSLRCLSYSTSCLSFMNLLMTLTWTTWGVLWRSKFTSEDSQINLGLWEAWSALKANLALKIGTYFLAWKLLTFFWYGHWDFLSSSFFSFFFWTRNLKMGINGVD
jgi:hypothetical protein